jgi:hypothetical protein
MPEQGELGEKFVPLPLIPRDGCEDADPNCANCDDCTRDGNCCFDCGIAGKGCPKECQHFRKAEQMKAWPDEEIVKRVEDWILSVSETMPIAWQELRRRIDGRTLTGDTDALAEKIATKVLIGIGIPSLVKYVSTKDLVEELAQREGVIEETVAVGENYHCAIGYDEDDETQRETIAGTGPARILVVTD